MIEGFIHPRTLILLAVGGAILLLALRSLRAHRLKERYVLLLLLTGLPFLFLAVWPDAIVFVADLLEIEKPTLLSLCVAVYFLLTTFLLLSIVSVQDRRIATLGQMVSILMEERGRGRSPGARSQESRSSGVQKEEGHQVQG